MKRFLLALLIVPLLMGSSNSISLQNVAWVGVPRSSAPTYQFYEYIEGSNTDNQGNAQWNNTGWTSNDVGNIKKDSSYPPAPLQGTYSLELPAYNYICEHDFVTSTATVGLFLKFNTEDISGVNNEVIAAFRDVSNNDLVRLELKASGVLRLYVGSTSYDTGAGAITANTTYCIWLEMTNNGGATSTASLYISTTTTKPGTPSGTSGATGTGTITANASKFRVRGVTATATLKNIFDYIVADGTKVIGSNP